MNVARNNNSFKSTLTGQLGPNEETLPRTSAARGSLPLATRASGAREGSPEGEDMVRSLRSRTGTTSANWADQVCARVKPRYWLAVHSIADSAHLGPVLITGPRLRERYGCSERYWQTVLRLLKRLGVLVPDVIDGLEDRLQRFVWRLDLPEAGATNRADIAPNQMNRLDVLDGAPAVAPLDPDIWQGSLRVAHPAWIAFCQGADTAQAVAAATGCSLRTAQRHLALLADGGPLVAEDFIDDTGTHRRYRLAADPQAAVEAVIEAEDLRTVMATIRADVAAKRARMLAALKAWCERKRAERRAEYERRWQAACSCDHLPDPAWMLAA